MTKKYQFSCGCSFPIIGEPLTKGALPLLDVDANNLPSCENAWNIFARGDTKGVFQLESDLGKQWAKKLKPKSVEHLTALGALIRPGALKGVDDKGVSMTAHYCRRANFEESVESYHPAVDEVLKSTYGSLVFQEQSMELSRVIAGFTLQEADMLRKAMGKKSSSEMAKCKKMFIDGAKKTKVVSDEQAEEIFGWIEQSQKYSFNRCITKDTIVETQNGFKTIEELNIGDHVLSPDIKNNCDKYVLVKNKMSNGKKEVYEITTSSGKKLKCTMNHKILCSDGKKRTLRTIIKNKYAIICESDRKGNCMQIESIVSVKSLGILSTYDIEVDSKEHLFYGNGIAISNSHSCCYGLTGYDTAYLKSHFPVQFFTSWLFYAKDKADSQLEISDLIEDAKKFNILVQSPDLMVLNSNFYTDGLSIWFGITDVKGIGYSQFEKIKSCMQTYGKEINTWEEFVVKVSDLMPKSSIEKLISVNALRKFGSNRKLFLAEFNAWNELTEKEKAWIKENVQITNIPDMILNSAKTKKEGGCCSSSKRVDVLKSIASVIKNPPSPLVDIPSWISWVEKDLLGVSLTYNPTDSCDTSESNTTCKEYLDGKNGYMIFGVEVRRCKEVVTKAGKTPGSRMCFLSISDSTGKIDDVICFPNVYKDFHSLLKESNTVLIQGERDKKSDSLLVKKVVQI